jgi:hypothetical protein
MPPPAPTALLQSPALTAASRCSPRCPLPATGGAGRILPPAGPTARRHTDGAPTAAFLTLSRRWPTALTATTAFWGSLGAAGRPLRPRLRSATARAAIPLPQIRALRGRRAHARRAPVAPRLQLATVGGRPLARPAPRESPAHDRRAPVAPGRAPGGASRDDGHQLGGGVLGVGSRLGLPPAAPPDTIERPASPPGGRGGAGGHRAGEPVAEVEPVAIEPGRRRRWRAAGIRVRHPGSGGVPQLPQLPSSHPRVSPRAGGGGGAGGHEPAGDRTAPQLLAPRIIERPASPEGLAVASRHRAAGIASLPSSSPLGVIGAASPEGLAVEVEPVAMSRPDPPHPGAQLGPLAEVLAAEVEPAGGGRRGGRRPL